MISPIIKWKHDEQWTTGRLTNENIHTEHNYMIRSYDDKFKFVRDHVIDGKNLYPGLGYLVSSASKLFLNFFQHANNYVFV